MKIEKEKHKVTIVCMDKSVVRGYLHLDPGIRLSDFVNREKEQFIVLTEAIFQNIGEIHAFKLYSELSKKKGTILLNKDAIKWVEES